MAMKKLAPDIQSLFCASTQISTYKNAVEELVYNSLDADATSIAIRVNIDENSIQVIDNGIGVQKDDFKLVGQRYATSKCIDMSTLKSALNKYGFRGQSLAGIIEVSKRLTITSRYADTEETWTKEFYKGKEHKLAEAFARPSKGTTMEIKGFLYNLHIQKNSVDSLTEISDIRTFLQRLSLVHNNISLSLRDDSKNEIVFKLHKNRDIYQTLFTVLRVNKRDVLELKVEKNEYKVTAFIAKRDRDINKFHWVYLNGKFVDNSKINKVIDEYLIKLLGLKNTKKRIKSKNNLVELEDVTSKKTIPMYFIFITCPYYDYDIICKSKPSTLVFKDWEHLKKLIEKLVQFYVGDIGLKEINITKRTEDKANKKEDETREQVKKIIERILRSNSMKPRVSQIQNGVKGINIKRKHKEKIAELSLGKALQTKKSLENIVLNDVINHNKISKVIAKNIHDKNIIDNKEDIISENNNKPIKNDLKHKNFNTKILKTIKNIDKENILLNLSKENLRHKSNVQKVKKKATTLAKKKPSDQVKYKMKQKIRTVKKMLHKSKRVLKCDKTEPLYDPILNKFRHQSDSVKHRCNVLARNVENLLSYQKNRKRKIFVNETVHYSTVVKNNKNVSVQRKVEEIVIQDFIPLPPRFDPCSIDDRVWKKLPEQSCKSSYDLIQTVLKSQGQYSTSSKNTINAVTTPISNTDHIQITDDKKNETDNFERCDVPNPNDYESLSEVHKFTYDSHHHYRSNNSHHYRSYNNSQGNNISSSHFGFTETRNGNKHFITKESRDNFTIPDLKKLRYKFQEGLNNYFLSTRQPHKRKQSFINNYEYNNKSWPQDKSFTIDFTKSNNCEGNMSALCEQNTYIKYHDLQQEDFGILQSNTACGGTYTIISNTSQTSLGNGDHQYHPSNRISLTQRTYSILTSNERRINSEEGNVNFVDHAEVNEELVIKDNETAINDMNIVFVSKSQDSLLNHLEIEPVNICKPKIQSDQNIQTDDNINNINFNDSLFNNDFSIDSVLFDRDAYTHVERIIEDTRVNNDTETYSQYFVENKNNWKESQHILRETDKISDFDIDDNDKTNANKYIFFKTRPRFVPKGLSPIFENCQTTKACNYNLEKEYYEDTIYNQFANKVQVQSEVFEPNIQHMKEMRAKDIARVNERLDKDSASLVFNAESLEQAIVLRQVDSKFIAVKIKGRCYKSADVSKYLVLFDQHAVHERIILEKNLADYLIKEEWRSVALDEIPLKLAKEEVISMHNYKDKFSQFGLQWIVLNNEEIKITGIPEAILGKNLRQVDVVLKAVRNLISEEIQSMKNQKGCVSLYPKSIMDLVFSEACRYAIKFGDKLSTHECMDLLKSLAKCKTPFQCAHGRPVMAVLMSIESNPNRRHYQIVTSKLHQFISSRRGNQQN